MDRRSVVVDTARSAIANGERRVLCPVCQGGSSRENSLSIWELSNGQVFATCHRANCDVGTVCVVTGGGLPAPPPEHRRSPPHIDYSRPSRPSDWHWLKDHYEYQFSMEAVFRYVRATEGALYFPMYDADGERRGVVVRPYKPRGPKALSFADEGYCGLSWYVHNFGVESSEVCVVEDTLSALALYDMGVDAIALNGTKISRPRYDAIMERKERIVMMLDADATRQALEFCRRFGPDRVRVVRLVEDIKNMTREQVRKFLEEAGLL